MNTKLSHMFRWILLALLVSGCSLPNSTATPTPLGELQVTVTQIPATEAPTQPVVSANDKCGNQYYPVANGASWTYNGPTGQFTHTLSTGENGTFTITVQSEKNTFIIQGVCLDGGDIRLLDVPGVSLSTSGEAGNSSMTATQNDGITLPGDIQKGDDWSQTIGVTVNSGGQSMDFVIDSTYTADDYETVTVPAGTFYALKITQSASMGSGNPTVQTLWYVSGVGMVKSETNVGEILVNELVSYNIP